MSALGGLLFRLQALHWPVETTCHECAQDWPCGTERVMRAYRETRAEIRHRRAARALLRTSIRRARL